MRWDSLTSAHTVTGLVKDAFFRERSVTTAMDLGFEKNQTLKTTSLLMRTKRRPTTMSEKRLMSTVLNYLALPFILLALFAIGFIQGACYWIYQLARCVMCVAFFGMTGSLGEVESLWNETR